MKATVTSTTAVIEMKDCDGRPFKARVWEGATERGVPFTAYISVVQTHRKEDNAEFERDLTEHSKPSPDTLRAIDARFIL